jgi:hypothetical protein
MHCPKKPNGSGKDNGNISLAITSSSIRKIKKDLKSMTEAVTKVTTQLALLKEANSDISESDGDEEASHLWTKISSSRKSIRSLRQEPQSFPNRQVPRSSLTSGRSYSCKVSQLWISSITKSW